MRTQMDDEEKHTLSHYADIQKKEHVAAQF